MSNQFIGVYATKERSPSIGDFPRATGKRKRLWFVWKTPEEKYKVQALNAAHRPMAEPRVIASREFENRFTFEAACDAVPEGYVRPGSTPEAAGLPVAGAEGVLPRLFQETPDEEETLRADDPDLVIAWAKAEARTPQRGAHPLTIPFDRLVGEIVKTGDARRPMPESFASSRENADPDADAETRDNTEQMRFLRSRFVQALLLLRRGEREECVALLQEMLLQPSLPFEGGEQLFSEFGLGLRRLGFIPLALAAHKRALEFSPDNPRVLFNIARSLHDLGQFLEAREFLERSLAAKPDFADARQFLAFLEAGDAARHPARQSFS